MCRPFEDTAGATLIVEHEGGPAAANANALAVIVEVFQLGGIFQVEVWREGDVVSLYAILVENLLRLTVGGSTMVDDTRREAHAIDDVNLVLQPDHEITEEHAALLCGVGAFQGLQQFC